MMVLDIKKTVERAKQKIQKKMFLKKIYCVHEFWKFLNCFLISDFLKIPALKGLPVW